MTASPNNLQTNATIELGPNYVIPLVIILGGVPLILIQPWLCGIVSLFGLFLLVQTVLIRLKFTDTALDVYRGNNRIKSFPYREWETWQIFWEPIPILFYFKEVNSIHFLPIIFDKTELVACLERYVPLDRPAPPSK
ncbi:MAG: DUF3119 family protein [Synechococcaceae cyanobacterium RL_1_2]|nr:DUF3119 family protein [Synechococcaceae cyanobacterium RL_1_2]